MVRDAAMVVMLALWTVPAIGQEAAWPDFSQPVQAVGGGEHDAAVVVGIAGYAFVGPVPGAETNAQQWRQYFADTRGVPPENIKLLTGVNGTRGEILDAARQAAKGAGPEGTLWFVFIGQGAPAADGKDGLLLGVDAPRKAKRLEERGLRRGELLKVLAASPAGAIRVILDAGFSGRRPDGSMLAPGLKPLLTAAVAGPVDARLVVLTAAKGNQVAGALPGADRPAFSYLVLGGLRGWAAQSKGAAVTAGDLWRYAKKALEATLRGRDQTPGLIGKEDALAAFSAGEKGPDLARLAGATAAGGGEMFEISSLPPVPKTAAPEAIGDISGGADWRDLDVEALGKYDEAAEFDKSEASAEDKAQKWRDFARSAPKFAEPAEARTAQWERYAKELAAQEEARRERAEARDQDWDKLSRLLAMKTAVSGADKRRWAMLFVQAYGKTSSDDPYIADLAGYLPPGTVRVEPGAKPAEPRAGKTDIEWFTIPGGSFMMGVDDWPDTTPQHQVTIKTFQMAKTLVTNKQYQACVQAGACTAPQYEGDSFKVDDQPVVSVDWNQARTFCKWAGGRLPSEAEWEYAARSGGKEQKYPWGDEEATCARAVISEDGNGCGRNAPWPVCSKPAGNTEQGLCDMAGNVWEWMQDWYHGSYEGAPTDGSAWENPPGAYRALRGGSWYYDARIVRSADRHCHAPGTQHFNLGFRPARSR